MSYQCNGYTLKGERCKKKTSSNNQYCVTHSDNISSENVSKYKPKDKGKKKENLNTIKFDISFNLLGYNPIGECAICCDNVYDINNAELECGHIFHIECVKTLRNPTCPCCRMDLKSKKLTISDLLNIKKRQMDDNIDNNSIAAEDYQRDDRELYNSHQRNHDSELEDEEMLNSILALSVVEYIEYFHEITKLSPYEIFSLLERGYF